MEEVWKAISLPSLQDNHTRQNLSHTPPTLHNPTSSPFQDFLARPFCKDPPHSATTIMPMHPPPTALCLTPQFHFPDNNVDHHCPASNAPSLVGHFHAFSGIPPFVRKKSSESDSSSGDRRHKRMMKNRESAARSRARKQAYTSQLESEVSQLMEENARLKKQQEQLWYAAGQLPQKHKLHRASTAPF